MNEQAIIKYFQDQVASGKPAAQVAMQLASQYPQFAQRLQQLAGGQPGPATGQQPAGGMVGNGGPVKPAVPQSDPAALGAETARGTMPSPAPAPGAPQKAPGYYQAAPAGAPDKYGGTMRGNTNAAGVQSNGDDDPWSIGAGRGTTYDPEVLMRWHERAKAGDGKAAYVLRQVGFYDEQNRPVFAGADGMEQWANSRSLDRRAAAGSATPWYHDPKNWGGKEGFTGAADADTAFNADPWGQLHNPNDRPSSYPASRGRQPVGQGGPEALRGGANHSPAGLTAAFNDRGTGGDGGFVQSTAPAYQSVDNAAPDEPDGPGPETDVDPVRPNKDPKLRSIDPSLEEQIAQWYGKR